MQSENQHGTKIRDYICVNLKCMGSIGVAFCQERTFILFLPSGPHIDPKLTNIEDYQIFAKVHLKPIMRPKRGVYVCKI